MRHRRRLLSGLCAVLSITFGGILAPAFAQAPHEFSLVPYDIGSVLMTAPIEQLRWPGFEAQTHSFGLAIPNEPVSHRFQIKNTSDQVWTLDKLEPRTENIEGKVDWTRIEPGATAAVDVTYRPQLNGDQVTSGSVAVRFAGNVTPVMLAVSAAVRRPLQVTRERLDLRIENPGDVQTTAFHILNYSLEVWPDVDIEMNANWLTLISGEQEPPREMPVGPTQVWTCRLWANSANLPPGKYDTTLKVRPRNQRVDQFVEIPISLEVGEAVALVPSVLFHHAVHSGDEIALSTQLVFRRDTTESQPPATEVTHDLPPGSQVSLTWRSPRMWELHARVPAIGQNLVRGTVRVNLRNRLFPPITLPVLIHLRQPGDPLLPLDDVATTLDLLRAGMLSERGKLRQGTYRAQRLTGAGGATILEPIKPDSEPEDRFGAFDYDRGLIREDRNGIVNDRGRPEQALRIVAQRPDLLTVFHSGRELVELRLPGDPVQRLSGGITMLTPPPDLRRTGLFVDSRRRTVVEESVQSSLPPTLNTLSWDGDGILKLARDSVIQENIKTRYMVWINVAHGFTPIRRQSWYSIRPHGEPLVCTDEMEFQWREVDGVWVPVRELTLKRTFSNFDQSLTPDQLTEEFWNSFVPQYQTKVESVTYDWETVSKPLARELFDYASFNLPFGTRVNDYSTSSILRREVIGFPQFPPAAPAKPVVR